MIKDKGTLINAHAADVCKELVPDKIIDISEGIKNLIELRGSKTVDQLREHLSACCLQACDCCLQVS